MFLGEYSHTVDSKGRVFIPAKYRDELGTKFVITKGTDKCLSVYPMEYWNAYVAKIEALPTAQAAKIRRFVFAQACDVEQDSQGRALLSQSLRDYAVSAHISKYGPKKTGSQPPRVRTLRKSKS